MKNVHFGVPDFYQIYFDCLFKEMAYYLHVTWYHDMIIFAKIIVYFIAKYDICCVISSIRRLIMHIIQQQKLRIIYFHQFLKFRNQICFENNAIKDSANIMITFNYSCNQDTFISFIKGAKYWVIVYTLQFSDKMPHAF